MSTSDDPSAAVTTTDWWPEVCPGVVITDRPGSSSVSPSSSSNRAFMKSNQSYSSGDSRLARESSVPCTKWGACRKTAFWPQWSKCRCVLMTMPMSAGLMPIAASASAAERFTTRQSVSSSSGPPTPVSTSAAPPGWMTTKPWTGHSRPSGPRRLARCSRLISSVMRRRPQAGAGPGAPAGWAGSAGPGEPPAMTYDHSSLLTPTDGGASPPDRSAAERCPWPNAGECSQAWNDSSSRHRVTTSQVVRSSVGLSSSKPWKPSWLSTAPARAANRRASSSPLSGGTVIALILITVIRLIMPVAAGLILATMPRTRMYRNGILEDEGFPVDKVSDYLADPTAVVWFDMCEPTAEDLSQISEELGLHPLAVEDAVAEHQRAKLDRYQSHIFVTSYGVKLNTGTGELEIDEVDAFVTDRALVTVRRSPGFDIDAVVRRWDDSPDLATCGVGFLLYGLLDYVVDTHFEAVQSLDTQIEVLEDQLFDDNPRDKEMQRRTFELRKSLVVLRRVVLPMREVLNSLLRRDLHVVDGEIMPYFHDIYDHVLRATEWTESLRDLVTTILETHLTVRGNRLNVIMKQVTSWAAIIAVPTAVTGFYGQNVPYPGFSKVAGFWASTVIVFGLSLTLYVIFRRKEWL